MTGIRCPSDCWPSTCPVGTIEASDGELRDLLPGTILLAEDTTGKGHISAVTGTEEMLVLIVLLPE